MTIEEALDYLKDPIGKSFDVHREALKVAREALEKQIPKKPIELPEEETFYDGGYYGHKCGMCEFPVYDDQIYCDKCGQKLDWGGSK